MSPHEKTTNHDHVSVRSPSPATLNEDDEHAEDDLAAGNKKAADVVTSTESENDTLIVDWDGPDDPDNPKK